MQKFSTLLLLLISVYCSAQNPEFRASEWGTFTTLSGSDGTRLNGLFVSEEPLPKFVENLTHSHEFYTGEADQKGYPRVATEPIPLLNVNVKMETPVIYFYSDEAFDVNVRVDFPRGSISQWYPHKTGGEVSTYLWNVDYNPTIDFQEAQNGFIVWDVKVLNRLSSIQNTHWDIPKVWAAPRLPKSSKVQHKAGNRNQVEEYLFYRGLGNFDIPINGYFEDDENFILQNTGDLGAISYFVFENRGVDQLYFHHQGSIHPQSQKRITLKEESIDNHGYRDFWGSIQSAMMENGLTWEESEAMLNTWEESYFKKEGFKVFWIVPRELTDELLPIQITPKPSKLDRVMVGRSEFLTPQFEAQLLENGPEQWAEDRYIYAYKERFEQLKDSKGTTSIEQYFASECDACHIHVIPNPVQGEMFVRLFEGNKTQQVDLILVDLQGAIIEDWQLQMTNGIAEMKCNLSDLASGIYFLKSNQLNQVKKVIIANN